MRKERKAVVLGIRDENPGAVVWVWVEGQDFPELKATGNNPELEKAVISEAKRLAFMEEEVLLSPTGYSTHTVKAGLFLEHFPERVVATLLNTRPGRTEIMEIVPESAQEELPEVFPREGYLADEENYYWDEEEPLETDGAEH